MKRRKKLTSASRVPPTPATRPLERWSLDFLSDSLADGRRFRILTIVDNVSRVSPAIEVGASLTGKRVVAILERLTGTVGRPERIAVDNGPEFISKALDAWAYHNRCAGPMVRLNHGRSREQRWRGKPSRGRDGRAAAVFASMDGGGRANGKVEGTVHARR